MRILLVAIACWCTSCGAAPQLVRQRGEQLQMGRTILPSAYIWYLRGRDAERAGDNDQAGVYFALALRADPRSAAVLGSLIRVSCRGAPPQELLRPDSRRHRRVDRPAVAWTELARCLKKRGAVERASEVLERALADEPFYLLANKTILENLRQQQDEGRARARARAYRLATGRSLDAKSPAAAVDWRSAIDRAFLQHDLARAQNIAAGRISAGALASRALARGQIHLAKEQARLVAAADPWDPDAILCLHLLGARERSAGQDVVDVLGVEDAAAPGAPTPSGRLSLVGRLLLLEQIVYVAGSSVARQLVAGTQEEVLGSQDPLAKQLFRALVDRL